MENEKPTSDRRSVTWLIVAGFVIAGLSVIVIAIMAYNQMQRLRSMVVNPEEGVRYEVFLDSLSADYDRASFSARYQVLYGEEQDATVWEKLTYRHGQLSTLDTLGNLVSGKDKDQLSLLKDNYVQRYKVLSELRELSTPVPLPGYTSLKRAVSRKEFTKVDTLFQALQMEGTDVVVIDWDDLKPDVESYDEVFPYLLTYAQNNAERSQQITELVQEDQRLIYSSNVNSTRIKLALKEQRKEGVDDIVKEVGRVSSNIGFSVVLIIVFSIALLIKIVRDIERNRQLEEELRRAKLQAESLAKAKEEFLANMSHEMRTPMNAIIGFSSQLSKTKLDSHQQSILQPIRHSADFLLALINDILDYSKLEAGKFTLAREHFDLRQLVQEVGQLFIPKAQDKGIQLHVDLAENVPHVVIGDDLRLRQMLMNLAGNAVKFTDRGSVSIKVESVNKKAHPHKVLFQVIDTGIGIPAEQQDRIFQDFIQVDGSNSRRYGGTGLGLSITKKLSDLHGGDLLLESKEGKGTKVQLLLTYEGGKESEVADRDEKPVNAHPELAGKRVLLADDEPYNRMLVRDLLESWRMEVTSATNGKEVLAAMSPPELYSVLLLDLQMPELDGIETSIRIREDFSEAIPILALTATSSPSEQQKALEAGMQGVMLKPFKAQELHDTLLDLMNIQDDGVERVLDEPEVTSDENPFPELFKVTRGDERMIKRMLGQYLSLTDNNFANLKKHYEERDAKNMALIAHRMIPANRHLSFQFIVNHLKRIEELGEEKTFSEELDSLMKELEGWLEKSKEKVSGVLGKMEGP